MKSELFVPYETLKVDNISNFPKTFYKQERDWTCSVAAIRTILSSVGIKVECEDYYIDTYNLKPLHYFSRDIKNSRILSNYSAIFSCDYNDNLIDLRTIYDLIKESYFVMAECAYNYSQWMVVLGYFTISGSVQIRNQRIIVYDPYFDEVRTLNAEEFYSMWSDSSGHMREFIAVKKCI